jgi:hypothetical protein
MLLGSEEIEDVRRVLGAGEESDHVGVGYLAEANRASSPKFFLAMLVISLEAFAGQTTVKRECEKCGEVSKYQAANRDALIGICGKELYDQIYRTDRLRHKLFHGGKVVTNRVAELAGTLYERLVLDYIKRRHDLSSVRRITAAPRNISYEFSRVFVGLRGEPDLLALEQESDANRLNIVNTPDRY